MKLTKLDCILFWIQILIVFQYAFDFFKPPVWLLALAAFNIGWILERWSNSIE